MSIEQMGTGFSSTSWMQVEERQEDRYRESQMQILARRDIL